MTGARGIFARQIGTSAVTRTVTLKRRYPRQPDRVDPAVCERRGKGRYNKLQTARFEPTPQNAKHISYPVHYKAFIRQLLNMITTKEN